MFRLTLIRTTIILVVLVSAMLISSCTGDSVPNISVSTLSIVPAQLAPDQSVKIGINIQNSGKKSDQYSGVLKINDAVVETKELTVAAGSNETLIFDYTPAFSGSFRVDVNGQTGSFEVVKPAKFVAENLTVSPAETAPGNPLTAAVKVSNTGDLSGEYTAVLKVDGVELKSSRVSVEGGGIQNVILSFSVDTPGTHKAEIGDLSQIFKVLKAASFKATEVKISPTSALPGETVTIESTLTNEGEVKESQNVVLKVNGDQSGSQSLTLEGGASGKVSYTFISNNAGVYNVEVSGATGSFTVVSLSKYSNSELDYEISYPPAFTVNENDPLLITIEQLNVGGISIEFENVSTQVSPQSYFEGAVKDNEDQYTDWKLISQKEVVKDGVVNGYKFEYSYSKGATKYLGQGLVIKNAGLVYQVEFKINEKEWPRFSVAAARCVDSFKPRPSYAGNYSNPELGLALVLPSEWSLTETSSKVLNFSSPYNKNYIGGSLSVEAVTTGTAARQYVDSVASQLASRGWKQDKGAAFTFADGTAGYQTSLSGYTSGNVVYVLKVFAVVKDGRAVVMSFVASSANMTDDINQLARSLVVSKPGGVKGVDRQNAIFIPEGEIVTLDPAVVQTGPGDIVGAVFSGLVKLDTSLQVAPDLAESWKVSTDGKIYTFNLRKNAKFHNGRGVTAADVKYSWERACDPALKSPKAKSFLADISGAKERLAGTAVAISGVKVIDDYTLEVTLDSAKPYFLGELCQPVAFIVDKADIARGANWYEQPNGTGAFKIKTWDKDTLLVLERFDDFYLGAAKVKNLVFKLFAGNVMALYENGEIDLAPVGTSNQDRVLDTSNPLNKEVVKGSVFNMDYIGFNVTQPPFDDVKIRQAAAAALDVSKLIEVSMKGRTERSAGYIPPEIPGNNSGLQPIPFSLEKARQLIKESKYGSVENIPAITYYVLYGATPVDEAIIGMWQTLGLKVNTEVVSSVEDYLARGERKEFQVWNSGWRADYVDPQNFLDVLFQSKSPENNFAYNNPEVDAALAKAAIELDPAIRVKMYQDIEQMILSDLPAIPLFCKTQSYVLVKPYVKGFAVYPMDINIWRELSVVAH